MICSDMRNFTCTSMRARSQGSQTFAIDGPGRHTTCATIGPAVINQPTTIDRYADTRAQTSPERRAFLVVTFRHRSLSIEHDESSFVCARARHGRPGHRRL